jgi:hypothetical protein
MLMKLLKQSGRVRDLGLAAALVGCGIPLSGTTKNEEGRSYFLFEPSDELDKAINDYWTDKLTVKARKYSDDIKMLKSRIYSAE